MREGHKCPECYAGYEGICPVCGFNHDAMMGFIERVFPEGPVSPSRLHYGRSPAEAALEDLHKAEQIQVAMLK